MKWLPLEEWWYNTTFHTFTKMNPFETLYGYPTLSISLFLQDKSTVQAIPYIYGIYLDFFHRYFLLLHTELSICKGGANRIG